MNTDNVKFLALRKDGGSVFAVLRITIEAYTASIVRGESVDAGLLIHKGLDETRGSFKARAEKELGVPATSPIWGEDKA